MLYVFGRDQLIEDASGLKATGIAGDIDLWCGGREVDDALHVAILRDTTRVSGLDSPRRAA